MTEPPSQPGEPEITDFDNKSVTLKWAKPKDDGGRPITHYVIQKKDKFGGWFDALVTDDKNCHATIDDLEARVPGLSEGKWYQSRVIAVNKAGESEPSPHTKPHLCRHKNRKSSQSHLNICMCIIECIVSLNISGLSDRIIIILRILIPRP